ncbi:hypothetical protein [Nonomuraea sp. NPDC003804]|uniref:hypothetical protein n=1 Tax=Nonomuraea sp. NPDC003804 TaxID=3154547 RepID=UPI0033BB837F
MRDERHLDRSEAVAAVTEMVPPPDVDADGEMRALLASRIATVSGFLKTLTTVIEFGANAEGARQSVIFQIRGTLRCLSGHFVSNLLKAYE